MVHFMQPFGLSETFPLAPLLKTYIEELKNSPENNMDANASLSKNGLKCRELLAERYHYTPPAPAYEAAPFPYGESFSAPKPFQYTPGSVAASYNSSQYKVAYGGPGAQPGASGYAGYTGTTGPSASSSYANYLGSSYRPNQQ